MRTIATPRLPEKIKEKTSTFGVDKRIIINKSDECGMSHWAGRWVNNVITFIAIARRTRISFVYVCLCVLSANPVIHNDRPFNGERVRPASHDDYNPNHRLAVLSPSDGTKKWSTHLLIHFNTTWLQRWARFACWCFASFHQWKSLHDSVSYAPMYEKPNENYSFDWSYVQVTNCPWWQRRAAV